MRPGGRNSGGMLVPRAWLVEFPAGAQGDDRDLSDIFGNIDVQTLRDGLRAAKDEDGRVRMRRCSEYMSRTGLKHALWNIAVIGHPTAVLALKILKADTAGETMNYDVAVNPASRNPLVRRVRYRKPTGNKLVRQSLSLVKRPAGAGGVRTQVAGGMGSATTSGKRFRIGGKKAAPKITSAS